MFIKLHLERFVKLMFICIIYILSLLVISPIIDHSFGKLDETESNGLILFEIISQILVISIIWYYYSIFMKQFIRYYLKEIIVKLKRNRFCKTFFIFIYSFKDLSTMNNNNKIAFWARKFAKNTWRIDPHRIKSCR